MTVFKSNEFSDDAIKIIVIDSLSNQELINELDNRLSSILCLLQDNIKNNADDLDSYISHACIEEAQILIRRAEKLLNYKGINSERYSKPD